MAAARHSVADRRGDRAGSRAAQPDHGRDWPGLPDADHIGRCPGRRIVLWGITSVLRGGAGLFLRAVAALAGAVIGGLVASLLADVIVDAPFAFAVGWRAPGRSSGAGLAAADRAIRARRGEVGGFVPAVIWILLVLAAIPAIQAGAEIIITRASVPAFVERQIGFSSESLVEIRGLAQCCRRTPPRHHSTLKPAAPRRDLPLVPVARPPERPPIALVAQPAGRRRRSSAARSWHGSPTTSTLMRSSPRSGHVALRCRTPERAVARGAG